MGRNRNRTDTLDLNMDSLLDIISNVLGIMIFLAIIIVLLPSSTEDKIIEVESLTESEFDFLHTRMPVIVDIPWSRMEDYDNIVISIAYDDHLIYIDFARVYSGLKDYIKGSFYFEREIDGLFNITSIPVNIGDAKNAWLSFSPPEQRHLVNSDKYSELNEVVQNLPPSRTRLVFFVYPSGHNVFFSSYHKYRKQGYNISWFAIPSEQNKHYIGYSYDGTKVEAE